MDVDFMVDCVRCSAQNWCIEDITNNYVEFLCQSCNLNTKVGTCDDEDYYDCHLCLSTNWSVADKTEDHMMFECCDCSSIIEFWLKPDNK